MSRVGSLCPSVQSVSLHIKPEIQNIQKWSATSHPPLMATRSRSAQQRSQLHTDFTSLYTPLTHMLWCKLMIIGYLPPCLSTAESNHVSTRAKVQRCFTLHRMMLLFVNKNKTLSQRFFTKRGRPVLCQIHGLHVLKSVQPHKRQGKKTKWILLFNSLQIINKNNQMSLNDLILSVIQPGLV